MANELANEFSRICAWLCFGVIILWALAELRLWLKTRRRKPPEPKEKQGYIPEVYTQRLLEEFRDGMVVMDLLTNDFASPVAEDKVKIQRSDEPLTVPMPWVGVPPTPHPATEEIGRIYRGVLQMGFKTGVVSKEIEENMKADSMDVSNAMPVTKDNILDLIVAAGKILDEAPGVNRDRWCVISPWIDRKWIVVWSGKILRRYGHRRKLLRRKRR